MTVQSAILIAVLAMIIIVFAADLIAEHRRNK